MIFLIYIIKLILYILKYNYTLKIYGNKMWSQIFVYNNSAMFIY